MNIIGVQTWPFRENFLADPAGTLKGFDSNIVFELSGTGGYRCAELAGLLQDQIYRVVGAHVCSMEMPVAEFGEIVRQYMTSFTHIKYVTVFFDPDDITEMADLKTRFGVVQKYQAKLHEYKRSMVKEYGNLVGDGKPHPSVLPTLVYHTYIPDFWPILAGTTEFASHLPAFYHLHKYAAIQIDSYFAESAGFETSEFLRDFQVKLHSVHITESNSNGRHAIIERIRPGSRLASLLREIRKNPTTLVFLEYDLDTLSLKDIQSSVRVVSDYMGCSQ